MELKLSAISTAIPRLIIDMSVRNHNIVGAFLSSDAIHTCWKMVRVPVLWYGFWSQSFNKAFVRSVWHEDRQLDVDGLRRNASCFQLV